MIAYRKYYLMYPLLPWLHSTEVCEHLFGMLWQLKKDFTYSDVLQLERKLRVLQMRAFSNLTPKQQANETAQFPMDQELKDASQYGLSEAVQLLKLLRVDAKAMLRDYKDLQPVLTRPSMEPNHECQITSRDEEVFEACEMAIATNSVDQSQAIAALLDSTDESLEQLCTDIQQHLTNSTSDLLVEDSLLILTDANRLVHDTLVAERLKHQTKLTGKAMRQHGRLSTIMANHNNAGQAPATDSGLSLRQKMMQRLAAVVPDADTITKDKQHGPLHPPHWVLWQTYRGLAFSKFQWVHKNMHSTDISQINPLQPGHFFVGLKPGSSGGVVLCKVMCQEVPTTDGHPHTLVTCNQCNQSYKLFENLRANQTVLYFTAEELTRMAKSRDSAIDPVLPAADTSPIIAIIEDVAMEESDDGL
ncbi:hypothetical protein C8R45DRAFT_947252 [Mycena sanguinolenta]|nr:hypothetical protein C8R45DRAFT_947252 [Mycena sanguinolenta]